MHDERRNEALRAGAQHLLFQNIEEAEKEATRARIALTADDERHALAMASHHLGEAIGFLDLLKEARGGA